jgi:uncharacterized protein (TIGR02246 family)
MLRSLIFGLFAAASLSAQPSGEEGAVRDVIARYVAARGHSDAGAIAALFTDDADQLVSTGEWRKGRGEVVRGTLASSQSSGGTRTVAVESVRFLSPDVALADGRYEIAATAGVAARRMWSSFVLKRTAGGWRIAAIRNMLPAPPAR